jgi:hypothetical protein
MDCCYYFVGVCSSEIRTSEAALFTGVFGVGRLALEFVILWTTYMMFAKDDAKSFRAVLFAVEADLCVVM